jgi:hypothetical protein
MPVRKHIEWIPWVAACRFLADARGSAYLAGQELEAKLRSGEWQALDRCLSPIGECEERSIPRQFWSDYVTHGGALDFRLPTGRRIHNWRGHCVYLRRSDITGVPDNRGRVGRPGSRDIVREEARRRLAINNGLGLMELSRQLATWLEAEHPNEPYMRVRSIANAIRKVWVGRPRG